jgi:hypothetical protein
LVVAASVLRMLLATPAHFLGMHASNSAVLAIHMKHVFTACLSAIHGAVSCGHPHLSTYCLPGCSYLSSSFCIKGFYPGFDVPGADATAHSVMAASDALVIIVLIEFLHICAAPLTQVTLKRWCSVACLIALVVPVSIVQYTRQATKQQHDIRSKAAAADLLVSHAL